MKNLDLKKLLILNLPYVLLSISLIKSGRRYA